MCSELINLKKKKTTWFNDTLLYFWCVCFFFFNSSSNYVLTDEQSLWIEDTTKAVYQVGVVDTSIKITWKIFYHVILYQ